MSNGPFQDSKYRSNSARVYPCTIQPETLTLTLNSVANAAPTTDVTEEVSAIMRSGNKIGCNSRTCRVEVTDAGTGPYGVGAILTVPVLDQTVFNGYSRGQTGTYNGATVRFVGKTPEKLR